MSQQAMPPPSATFRPGLAAPATHPPPPSPRHCPHSAARARPSTAPTRPLRRRQRGRLSHASLLQAGGARRYADTSGLRKHALACTTALGWFVCRVARTGGKSERSQATPATRCPPGRSAPATGLVSCGGVRRAPPPAGLRAAALTPGSPRARPVPRATRRATAALSRSSPRLHRTVESF